MSHCEGQKRSVRRCSGSNQIKTTNYKKTTVTKTATKNEDEEDEEDEDDEDDEGDEDDGEDEDDGDEDEEKEEEEKNKNNVSRIIQYKNIKKNNTTDYNTATATKPKNPTTSQPARLKQQHQHHSCNYSTTITTTKTTTTTTMAKTTTTPQQHHSNLHSDNDLLRSRLCTHNGRHPPNQHTFSCSILHNRCSNTRFCL